MHPTRISIVQPAVARHQLATTAANHILGSGPMAEYALSRLSKHRQNRMTFVDDTGVVASGGNPTIDFRTFLATVPADAPVLFASDKEGWMSLLAKSGQAHILDVRGLFHSDSYLSAPECRPCVKQTVCSAVPRSGLQRIHYFLFALNERLEGAREISPSPHRAFLSLLSTDNESRNWPATRRLLRTDDLCIGQFLPPGALALLSDNEALAREHSLRAARFIEACERQPALCGLSHFESMLELEPRIPAIANFVTTSFALLTRDVVEQMISVLTTFELIVKDCKTRGADGWPLEIYVEQCRELGHPFLFGRLEGQTPLIVREAIATERSFTDVVLARNLWECLVTDYAIQTYCATYFQRHPSPRVRCRVFHYENMMSNETAFFKALVEFMRQSPLQPAELELVSKTCTATNREWSRKAERDLGHSMAFRPGSRFSPRTLLTMTDLRPQWWSIQAIRDTVRAKVRRNAKQIRAKAFELLKAFEAAERRSEVAGNASTAVRNFT